MSLSATQKVLLTGASGTLGFNVMRLLAKETSHDLVAPVREIKPVFRPFERRVQFVQLNLAHNGEASRSIELLQPDVIVHCAASGVRPPKKSWFRSEEHTSELQSLRHLV